MPVLLALEESPALEDESALADELLDAALELGSLELAGVGPHSPPYMVVKLHVSVGRQHGVVLEHGPPVMAHTGQLVHEPAPQNPERPLSHVH